VPAVPDFPASGSSKRFSAPTPSAPFPKMSKSQAVQTEAVRSSISPEARPTPPPPIPMHLSELKQHHVTQLVEMAVANGIEGATGCASRT